MLLDEARELLTYVQALWSSWEPNDAQLGVWVSALEKLADPRRARSAVTAAYEAKGRWREPRLPDIIEALAQLPAPDRPQSEPDVYDGYTGFWAVCPARGWALPMVYPAGNVPDLDRVRRAATAFLAGHANTYGGEWVLAEGCDTEQDALRAAGGP